MKTIYLIILILLVANTNLFAQKNETVVVKAGTSLTDYFQIADRYLYADFTKGIAVFRNNNVYPSVFNYNFLSGEMEFINANDTLIIADKANLLSVVVAQDTFYYDNGFLQKIGNGPLKVYVKEAFVMKDVRKKGAMGTVNRSAASESYDYMLTGYESKNLVADVDIAFRKEKLYFFSKNEEDFVRFNRLNIINSIPGKKDVINNYVTAVKTDFNSREDILKLSDIVNKILSENL